MFIATTGHQRTGEPQEGLWIASHLSSVMAIAEVFLGVSFDPALRSIAVRAGQYLLIWAEAV